MPKAPLASTPVTSTVVFNSRLTVPTAPVAIGRMPFIPQLFWFQAPKPQPESKTVTGREGVTLPTCPVAATPDTLTVMSPETPPDVPTGPCDNGEKPNIYY
jgi:hypothetical protein